MIVETALRNCQPDKEVKTIDFLSIEWYQASKRVQRLVTDGGKNIAIRFLGKGQSLNDGDVLYEDENSLIVVYILPCEAIVVHTTDLITLGYISYEIGNKHAPVFIENNKLCMPYERSMYDWLKKNNYSLEILQIKLLHPLNANVDFFHLNKITFTPPKSGISLKL